MLEGNELRKLQMCELLIADEIKRVCEKNNIRYFIVAGTLLGAVRHGGFIPWDDDMDFGMLREDYDRFVEVCQKELSPDYVLQTWDTDENYPFSFGKLRLNNTHIMESFSSPSNSHDGIFVDIFPFDNAPDNYNERKKQERRYYLYKRVLWIKKGYGQNIKEESMIKHIKYNVSKRLCSPVPYRKVKNQFDKIIRKYNGYKTNRVVFDAPYSYEKNCIDIQWAKDLNVYEFEGHSYPGIRDYDAYLSHLYGDYMTLPPEDKRHSHDIVKVDFGPYNL